MKRVIISFLLLSLIFASTPNKANSYSADPEKFISEIIDEAKSILNSKETKEQKSQKLSEGFMEKCLVWTA